MRMIFIGPAYKDDPYVHSIMQKRAEIISLAPEEKIKELEIGNNQNLRQVFEYQEFLRVLQEDTAPISEIGIISPDHKDEKLETDILDGQYPGYRQWLDTEIPKIRRHLHQAIQNNGTEPIPVLLHIDIGDCLSTLYYAYWASIMGLSYLLTFHNPLQPIDPQAERVTFAIGGHSMYARVRPMLRRHLAVHAIREAERVFVDQEGIGAALSSLFPQLPIVYFADPLTTVPSDESSEELPSQVEA